MDQLNGATRLYFIVGDPIAQVKSPAGVTEAFHSKGLNALCLPLHISAEDFLPCLSQLSKSHNVDGFIITVPHKFAALQLCTTISDRARFLGVVNTLKRNSDSTWHGDMFDGVGWVEAMRRKGESPKGKKALLIGAGGAGSAIAHALLEAAVGSLAIFDESSERQSSLVQRLSALNVGEVVVGTSNPRGFDIVVNATPQGMHSSDRAPVSLGLLSSTTYVADVITAPELTPLIAFARSIGCITQTGVDMFESVKELMVDFLVTQRPRQ
jgi:shikimate dehydrogenase